MSVTEPVKDKILFFVSNLPPGTGIFMMNVTKNERRAVLLKILSHPNHQMHVTSSEGN